MTMSAATPSAVPAGENMKVANLETIDLSRLLSRAPDEISKLLQACQAHGFFYLDLQTCDLGRQVVDGEQKVTKFMENYFDQPLDKKMKDDRGSVGHG